MFLVGCFETRGGRRAIYHSREDRVRYYALRSIFHVGRVMFKLTQDHDS
jgi:hypothetical protein